MITPDELPQERAEAAIKRSRDHLVLALDQLVSAQQPKEVSVLVGKASDEVGRAIHHLRRLIRERGEGVRG